MQRPMTSAAPQAPAPAPLGAAPRCTRQPRSSRLVRRAAEGEPSKAASTPLYFVAMNNFTVKAGSEEAFEDVWKNRKSKLLETPGFIRFNLLRGDAEGEYISESVWASRADFQAWTQSSNFQQAHQGQGASKEPAAKGPAGGQTAGMLAGPPRPKFFEAVTVTEQTLF